MKIKNSVVIKKEIDHIGPFFLLGILCLCLSIIVGCNRSKTTNEKRTILHLPLGNTTESVGSISIISHPVGYLYSTERPGDQLIMSFGGMSTGSRPAICSAEDSEIRFSGIISGDEFILTTAPESRLCFRKVKEGWAYICGIGRVEYPKSKEVFELGSNRTVNSCLALISSSDPILREGAARDLGRLTTQDEVPNVVPKLVALLKNSSLNVRRGAAEGLGLIGRQECVSPLTVALNVEKDKITQEFIAEALALCAASVLVKETSAPNISASEACKLFITGTTSWVSTIFATRIKNLAPDAIIVLLQHLDSPEACERLASLILLDAVKSPETQERIKRLSEEDTDEEVKAKAIEVLETFPTSFQ